jgi:hypothetical protein
VMTWTRPFTATLRGVAEPILRAHNLNGGAGPSPWMT